MTKLWWPSGKNYVLKFNNFILENIVFSLGNAVQMERLIECVCFFLSLTLLCFRLGTKKDGATAGQSKQAVYDQSKANRNHNNSCICSRAFLHIWNRLRVLSQSWIWPEYVWNRLFNHSTIISTSNQRCFHVSVPLLWGIFFLSLLAFFFPLFLRYCSSFPDDFNFLNFSASSSFLLSAMKIKRGFQINYYLQFPDGISTTTL